MRNYNPPNKSAVCRVSSNPRTRFKSMEWCILWYTNVGYGYTTEPQDHIVYVHNYSVKVNKTQLDVVDSKNP